MILAPSSYRLSPHFLLSDMMGCSSIYSRGLVNVFDKQPGNDIRLDNGKALCETVLEPLLALAGSVSISYGFISPAVSKEVVTYQDWRKPSHHRWDLGAAVDVCVHQHVLQSVAKKKTNIDGAPIMFALKHMQDMALSRLISYSESPYLCLAVSAQEVAANDPRMAWYENRFQGKKGAKPQYIKYPTKIARERALEHLSYANLDYPWTGGGFPSYHGGGRKQLHHIRTSHYTMLSDWLYDEESLMQGYRNIPHIDREPVTDAFRLAGMAYDKMLAATGLPRLSIVSAYTSHTSHAWIEGRDWRKGPVEFEIVPPEYTELDRFIANCRSLDWIRDNVNMSVDDDRVIVSIDRAARKDKRVFI